MAKKELISALLKFGARTYMPGLVPVVDPLLDTLAQRKDTETENSTTQVYVSPQQFWRELVKRPHGMYAVIGRPGTGKTALCLAICTILNRPTWVIGIPERHLEKLEFPAREWQFDKSTLSKLAQDIENVENGSVILIDDAALFFDVRSYGQQQAVVIEKLVMVRRHRDVTIIVNSQLSATVDKYLMSPDILFLKPPDLLFGDNERPYIQRWERVAEEEFAKIHPKQWGKWVYVVSNQPPFRGMLDYPLPPGWSDALSKNKA
jgi:hypothetical protein